MEAGKACGLGDVGTFEYQLDRILGCMLYDLYMDIEYHKTM